MLAGSDDGLDPDSHAFSKDPALEYVPPADGTVWLAVASYPDTDFDGAGGVSAGAYWLRVVHDGDADGDGVASASDNCPSVTNSGQVDTDADGIGDACDDDDDGDLLPDVTEWAFGTDPLNPDTDGDGVSDGVEVLRGTSPIDAGWMPGFFGGPQVDRSRCERDLPVRGRSRRRRRPRPSRRARHCRHRRDRRGTSRPGPARTCGTRSRPP